MSEEAGQIPMFEVQSVPAEGPPLPPPVTIFLVAAFFRTRGGGYWKIFRASADDEYTNRFGAEERAKNLPPGWYYPQILAVRLSADAEEAE